ncbi:alcohol dehydrogenase class IV [Edaphobacter modestus]|uniref:Alcohol dehydrogenase class IV n=2 Tax=Edaphobacter modestus TaxID=388466 RepID=A0A4Q7YYE2_9BACT|nr:alcohol dehydrogenase class IV [Edaphobacter modestus]
MPIEIEIPSMIKIGGGSFAEIPSLLKQLFCQHPLIVTDAFLMSQGLPTRLQNMVQQSGMDCAIFSETVSDPTTEAVDAAVRVFQAGGHDSLVSFGGGSSIDTAKAIGMLVANSGRCRDYKVPNLIPKAGPVHVAIPTTAGTGSEVTRFTVITDSANDEKMLIAGGALLPSAAVIDYELTLSMPARLTADTGTDSLTHAIEAYVSRKANRFADAFALTAMKTIWEQLPVAFHEPGNHGAREAMMLAATQAGIAFSNSSVALVHGMSRPLGAFFHVPHGLSNAMLLPAVTGFSIQSAPHRYADCARVMGIAAPADSPIKTLDRFVEALFNRNAELQVPSPKKYGISEDRFFEVLPTMAAQALASGSPQNNPRVPTAAEIEQLYREIWN